MASDNTTQQATNARTAEAFFENANQLDILSKNPNNIDTFLVEEEVFQDVNDTSYSNEIKGGWIGNFWTLKVQQSGISQSLKFFLADNESQTDLIKQYGVANEFQGDRFNRIVEEGTLSEPTFVSRVDTDIDEELTLLDEIKAHKLAEQTDLGTNGINWTRKAKIRAILQYLKELTA